ncbi:MAG: Phage integrase family protein, partial [Massilia sp.]|nr:Phage integrase family protein [Massilia sp.]
MASFDELIPAPSVMVGADPLRAATAAHLARYKGTTRMHTESDLRIYLTWCAERNLQPLTVGRHQVELYIR